MSISPSLSPRQCPDRYAFRAGRNLPDKEFRYLRTVILRPPFTGASVAGSPVIRSPTSLTFRHWAGVSPHTWSYDFAETCVFGKQSPGLVTATPFVRGHPFSRSYGAILPSSLERVVSRP
ncbi:uncharacterized protein DS421_6g187610 [Arachis hypogaea]|nr:uncharacterized protein DS421_6g187610 [Arachis hypogaea]